MECLALLAESRIAGLLVQTEGERLIVRGPKRHAALVARLLANKAGILAALEQDALAEAIARDEERAEREAIQAIEQEAELNQAPQRPAEAPIATPQAVYCPRCRSHRAYHDTAIHNGQGTRRDCQRCGGFIDFPKWSGTQ